MNSTFLVPAVDHSEFFLLNSIPTRDKRSIQTYRRNKPEIDRFLIKFFVPEIFMIIAEGTKNMKRQKIKNVHWKLNV